MTNLLTKAITKNDTITGGKYHTIIVQNMSNVDIRINENITLYPNKKWECINEKGVLIATNINIRFQPAPLGVTAQQRAEIQLYY